MPLKQNRRGLDLILMMTSINGASAEEMMRAMDTSRRNLYYYLAELRDYGFIINHHHKRYYIDPESPFLQQLIGSINFSETEAVFLYRMASAAERTPVTDNILRKLERFYNLNLFSYPDLQGRIAKNMERLCAAIDHKRLALLKDYASPHSGTVSNRVVEPYLIMNNGADVQCYELNSGRNKTFKISRMGEVIVSDALRWSHEYMHKRLYTDIFDFSGPNRYNIRLRLGLLSYNILREEYPLSVRFLHDDDSRHWILDTFVTSYLGVGRFVLGLLSDIDILADDGLRDYLRKQMESMQKKL